MDVYDEGLVDEPTARLPRPQPQLPMPASAIAPDLVETQPIEMTPLLPTQPLPTTHMPSPAPRWRLRSVLVALALILVMNLGAQANRRAFDIQSDTHWGLRRVQTCESLGRAPDVLFLGSSRTVYTSNAALVDRIVQERTGQRSLSCNAGILGSTLEQDYYTFKRLVEDGFAPRLVVENLWEYNLNINANPTADAEDAALEQIQALADLGDVPSLAQRSGDWWRDAPGALDFAAQKLIPLYGDRIGLLRAACGDLQAGPCGVDTTQITWLAIERYQQADAQGWVGVTDQSLANLSRDEQSALLAYMKAYYNKYNRNFAIGGRQMGYLAQMIALARAHSVEVRLAQPPLNPIFFQKAWGKPSDWATIIAYWNDFAALQGVPFYDQSHAPGYTDADFWDPTHLNAAGASKYSTWLAESVALPVLTR
ncbi:MAG TPA: hypothetical protein VHR15_06820 [Ktedonobacterales bacterium]|nr:hypothetical protein [Ktedonobacterales bacterium]